MDDQDDFNEPPALEDVPTAVDVEATIVEVKENPGLSGLLPRHCLALSSVVALVSASVFVFVHSLSFRPKLCLY